MRTVLSAAILAASLLPAAAESPVGVWLTEEQNSKIRIAPCGKALCATILWARPAGVDQHNPDPALRSRSVIGIDLSRDMKPDGRGGWAGSIYNPQNGNTYKVTLKPVSDRELEVGGCILGGLLCGSETWSRQSDSTASLAKPKH